MSKIEEPTSLHSDKTDGTEVDGAEVKSDTQFYDMFGDGVFGMMSHKIANVYRQLHSPVMTQALMLVLLAVGVANGEYFAIADVKGAFLCAMLLPPEVIYCDSLKF